MLAEYLLAALDADEVRLGEVLGTARRAQSVEVEVLALDTLARLHAQDGRTAQARALLDTADAAMPGAAHLITELDRVDRDRARALLGSDQGLRRP